MKKAAIASSGLEGTTQNLIKTSRLYHFLSKINQLIARTEDETTLFTEACRIATDTGKFTIAWIGLLDKKTNLLIPFTHKGISEHCLADLFIPIDPSDYKNNGSSTGSLPDGKYILCNDMETLRGMDAWRSCALEQDVLSWMAVPLKKSGKVIGAFCLCASSKNFFQTDEISLLQEAAADLSFIIDVHEKEKLRRKAEEAVLESQRRYHTLTEISPVGVFHTDVNGYTTYVNPCWCRITGMPAKEALGNGWLKAVHPEDRELLAKNWTNAVNNNRLSESEYRFVKPDGSITWVLGQAVPEINQQNQVIGYVGTTTDISGHKEAQIQITKLHKEKETILNRIRDGMVSLDREWRYTFLNDTALATHPLGREATLGKTLWEVHPEVVNTAFAKKYDEAMQTQQVQELEEFYAPMNAWFAGKAYPSPDGLTIFYTDITERKKIEAKILHEQKLSDSIINSLPGIFYLYTKKGRFLRWNKNFENVSGYSVDEIKNMHPLDFFDEEEKELLATKISHTFLYGEQHVQADFLIKSKEKIPYYFTGIAIEYEGNTCLMGVGIDFSERIRIQEEIKKTTRRLQELATHLQSIREEERKRIGREIHDELGQQLTAIKMDIAWINKRILPGQPEIVREKLANVIHLLDGSNLAIRRILSELRPAILDEHGLLDAMQWHNRRFTETSGIHAKLVTNETDITVSEEVAICIFRAYQEALTNIMRYAHADKVITSLKKTAQDIMVSIEDNGKGFDTETAQNGKSFGLLGMKERVRALNGRFELESAPGKGTRICIRLPLHPVQTIL